MSELPEDPSPGHAGGAYPRVDTMSDPDDLEVAVRLADAAGALLIAARKESFDAGLDPQAVGARGDRDANRLLLDDLARARPADAVLSEEAADDLIRLTADRVWIIDPLDGTREYRMAGRDDWAVHVALWQRDAGITAAAVGLPALGLVLTGTDRDAPPIEPADPSDGSIRVVVSESRPPAWLAPLGQILPLDVRPLGSAGFKAMAVVRGQADAYLHSGGQYEWDSAAPVGVATAAGFHASRIDGSPLLYNQNPPYLPDLMICRPALAGPLLAALRSVGAK
jgi:3'(2'), 5'-bisphosphate nucleotidase